MRKIKTIKIDDREITVKELRIRDIMDLAEALDQGNLMETLKAELPRLTDFPADQLEELAPSEIRQILDAAKVVNADFLSGARAVGLGKVLEQAVASIGQTFGGLAAVSSRPGTPDA